MKTWKARLKLALLAAPVAGAFWHPARAQDAEALKRDVDALKKEVQELRREAQQASPAAGEFRSGTSTKHFAGYADVGYVDGKRRPGGFDGVRFNPAFHYQYQDLVLLDAELETTIDANGATEVGLEFATVNLMLHDYVVFFAGKFLSPMGQFRQNLHPSWINKLPSVPVGFGHDQAAANGDVGAGLRGGLPLGAMQINYALYVGNGPRLELNAAGDEIEMIGTEGTAGDADGKKVWGGRLGLMPIPGLELGLSAASGKVVALVVGGAAEASRDYRVQGADLAYKWRDLGLRAEYARQRVGDAPASVAPVGGAWKAYYLQGTYRLAPTKWEGVARYGKFRTPHADQDQKQWALGVNYLFAPNVIAKAAYELNDGLAGTATDDNRLLLQLSYGF